MRTIFSKAAQRGARSWAWGLAVLSVGCASADPHDAVREVKLAVCAGPCAWADSAPGSEVALFVEGEPWSTTEEQMLLCPDEPLFGEVSISFCSGTLVAPDVVLTAAHCVEHYTCAAWRVTTAFDANEAVPFEPTASAACSEVIAQRDDLALVRISQPLPSETMSFAAAVSEAGEAATTVGHPLGTSTKVDLAARARALALSPGQVGVEADVFMGSSGGAVLNHQGQLLGVVVSGVPDFVWDDAQQCSRVVTRSSGDTALALSPLPILRDACVIDDALDFCARLPAENVASDDEGGLAGAGGTISAPSTSAPEPVSAAPEPASVASPSCAFPGRGQRGSWSRLFCVTLSAALLAGKSRGQRRRRRS